MTPGNGWEKHQELVLYRLEKLETAQAANFGEIKARLRGLELELTSHKVKAGVVGTLTGAVSGALMVLTALLLKLFNG